MVNTEKMDREIEEQVGNGFGLIKYADALFCENECRCSIDADGETIPYSGDASLPTAADFDTSDFREWLNARRAA